MAITLILCNAVAFGSLNLSSTQVHFYIPWQGKCRRPSLHCHPAPEWRHRGIAHSHNRGVSHTDSMEIVRAAVISATANPSLEDALQ